MGMELFSKVTAWFKRGDRGNAGRDKSELQRNMEKALHMKKKDTGSAAHIPEHRTQGEGMKPAHDHEMSDAARAADAGFTPQLKRSRVARSGDT
jgi:hypothetical protein